MPTDTFPATASSTPPPAPIRMLKEHEAARLLSVSAETLGAWRQARRGPPYTRLGSAIRYPEAALLRWVDLQTVTAPEARQ